MTRLQAAAIVAVLVAGAVAAVARALRPGPQRIAQIRGLLTGDPGAGSDGVRRSDGAATDGTGRRRRAGRLTNTTIARAVDRRHGDDLRAVGSSPTEVAGQILVAAAVGAFMVLLVVGSLVSLGRLPTTPLLLFAPPFVGAAFGWTMWRNAVDRIERDRRVFQQATNDFVQLVAVGLTTDQSVEEAVRFATSIGGGPGVERLRDTLLTAPQRGIPLWEALDTLGRRHHRRELCELATSIERQGTQGVSITETVMTLASSMRASALDELERDADRANANLSGPTIAFVVTTVVFLAYPLAIRISAAFGG